MNLWFEAVGPVTIVAPCRKGGAGPIDQRLHGSTIRLVPIPAISVVSISEALRALVFLPWICLTIIVEMARTDHIHLRCPGNIGFISIVLQRFFPHKRKTVKYAGNWDPDADDEMTVRRQKQMLRSSWWCVNMKVLVYGEWHGMPAHVVSLFTASFSGSVPSVPARQVTQAPVKLTFVGALEDGKRPEMVIQVLYHIRSIGIDAQLTLLGDGSLRKELEAQICEGKLSPFVQFLGAVSEEKVCEELRQSHFVLLLSRTEGWPKAIAEAMFFGVVPVGLRISCVPWMLGEGRRGILASADPIAISRALAAVIREPLRYSTMAREAMAWSRMYTLERMRSAVAELV